MKKFLHVGCGPKHKDRTTPGFNTPDWTELRLDIDPNVQPDIVGTLTDLSAVPDGSMNAVFSSHNIEHLYPHEVPLALKEFRRVLSEDGFVVVTCPDLKSVAKLIVDDKLGEPAYMSGMGPITPLDILYGHIGSVARGNHFMAHRGGFTLKTLVGAFRAAGFGAVGGLERPAGFELWVVACKTQVSDDELRAIATAHLPIPRRAPAPAAVGG